MLVRYSVEQFEIKNPLIEHNMEVFWGDVPRIYAESISAFGVALKRVFISYWYLCKNWALCPTISLTPTKDIIYRGFVSSSGRVRKRMIQGPR